MADAADLRLNEILPCNLVIEVQARVKDSKSEHCGWNRTRRSVTRERQNVGDDLHYSREGKFNRD